MKNTYKLYRACIEPYNSDPDDRRHELILNVLLCGLFLLATAALTIHVADRLLSDREHLLVSLITNSISVAFIGGLLLLSRRGYYKVSRLVFLALLMVTTLQLLLTWGYLLPQAHLFMALVVVMFGVLVSARAAFITAASLSLLLLAITYAQSSGLLMPDLSWQGQPLATQDAFGFIIVLFVIGLVSWLSNRETDQSLARARASEAALAAERDQLEVKVAERTRELEQAQLSRLMELQRFAEFGRLNAHLLHDIANPLTAASLHLEQATSAKSDVVTNVKQNLKEMERYIATAREQLRQEARIEPFNPGVEIERLTTMLEPLATKHNVALHYASSSKHQLIGNPVKFCQVVSNLIINAIDAYASMDRATKPVRITCVKKHQNFIITVSDNGSGIAEEHINQIFEPFFTTKATGRKGMGIGLYLVKQIVEVDFHGAATVASGKKGTSFRLVLPIQPSSMERYV